MSWWPRRRRRRYDPWEEPWEFPFEEFFEPWFLDEYIDRMFYSFRRMVDKLLEDAMRSGGQKSVVYGFTITIGPDGKPKIETFGNVPKYATPRITEEVSEEREPLVEVFEDKEKIYVTVELPGVDKDKINLEVLDGNKLLIKAEGENRKYRKVIELPAEIDPDSIKATYKNGILDITISKGKGTKGKSIKIE